MDCVKIRDSWLLFISLVFSTNVYAAFSFVANHPYAVLQATETGRTIQQLQAFEGGVYAGYGDWDANTGPIRLCKLSALTETFSCEFVQETEAVSRFRVLNGNLYSVSIDPQSPNHLGHAYAVKSDGVWSSVQAYRFGGTQQYPLHLYDMNIYDGGLWMFSERINVDPNIDDQHPTAWKSTDNGNTWSPNLEIPYNSFSRTFCFGQVFNGKLYVQRAALNCVPEDAFSYVFDGVTWSQGPNLAPTGRATMKTDLFADTMVMIHNMRLYGFDGISTTLKYAPPIYDYTINDDYLYVLTKHSMQVCRSSDLSSFQCFDIAPADARSIEVLDDVVYAGTTAGQIYKTTVSSLQPEILGILPVIYTILFQS